MSIKIQLTDQDLNQIQHLASQLVPPAVQKCDEDTQNEHKNPSIGTTVEIFQPYAGREGGERIWCKIESVEHGRYVGEIVPFPGRVGNGDQICFDSSQILFTERNLPLPPGSYGELPPGVDVMCDICHRCDSELKPFGGAGDPLVGDFQGALVVILYQEWTPGYTDKTRECRECAVREIRPWTQEDYDLAERYEREIQLEEASKEKHVFSNSDFDDEEIPF